MCWLCCQNNTNDVIMMAFDRLIDLSDENSTIVIYSAIWYEEVSRSHLMVDKRELASSIEMILSEVWPNAKNCWELLATHVVLCMQDGTSRQTSLIPSLILVLYLYPQCALVLSIWSPCKPLHCLFYAGILCELSFWTDWPCHHCRGYDSICLHELLFNLFRLFHLLWWRFSLQRVTKCGSKLCHTLSGIGALLVFHHCTVRREDI